jgi:hypothetical protein
MRRSRSSRRRPGPGSSDEDFQLWLARNRAEQDAAIDRDVARSCTSKDAYESEEHARAVAAMNGMADVLFTYECRYCRNWHLTRRPT